MKQLTVSLIFLACVYVYAQEETVLAPQNFNRGQGLRFEENKGQVADTDGKVRSDILFTMKDKGMTLFFRKDGISYQWHWLEELMDGPYRISEATGRPMNEDDALPQKFKKPKPTRLHTYRVDMQWLGADSDVKIISEEAYEDYNNYYHAHCPDGITGVKSYGKLIYKNMYPNVDIVYYVKEGKLKYDVLVHEGGDLRKVKFAYNGATPKRIDGKIRIETPLGFLEEQEPVAWGVNGSPTDIQYDSKTRYIGFKGSPGFVGTIDPNLVWATYYGATGNDQGRATTTDSNNAVYLGGNTGSISSISSGGHQNTFGGNVDAFLVKFNTSGVRQWATYYGGNEGDSGWSVAIDASDNIFLIGLTESSSGISFEGHQNTYGGNVDAFLVKFNASGIRQWATYYGGEGDDRGYAGTVDSSGNVYLAGYTSNSNSGIAFGGHQGINGGQLDAFLVKFNTSGIRQWGTYYGGIEIDDASGVAIDLSGNVYLAGFTGSNSAIAFGGHQNTFGGGGDAYLAKFNGDGILEWATYYGGGGSEVGSSVTTDLAANVFLVGYTTSTSGIASNGHQNTYGGGIRDAFIAKFDPSGVRQWGTYYGGTDQDQGHSVCTDDDGNLYIVGFTASLSGIAFGGHQSNREGLSDAFVAKLNSSGIRLWGSYIGGNGFENASSVAVDNSNYVFIAGNTGSSLGLAVGGHQNTYGGGIDDAMLIKLMGFLAGEPISQPGSVSFSSITSSSFNISYSAASPSPDGYLAVRRASAAPTSDPVDGTNYTVGQSIGDGTVASLGSSLSFSQITLSAATEYFYKIYSYNGSTGTYNFLQASPAQGSQFTLATEPTAQPTALTFPTFATSSLGGSFTAAIGSPAGYLVLRRQGASPTGMPVDGTTYTVGNTIGDGTVVSVGSGTTFNDTGLSPNTVYHYDIFSYNSSGITINYLTTSPLENSRTTLATEPTAQPTALTFPTFTETTLGGSFTAATGSPAGYLVLRRQGASPTGVPADGTTYAVGNTIGDGTVVAAGSGTTFNDTGLSPNTVYHYDVFSYNGSGTAINYRTTSPLEGSRTTLVIEPTAQPTALTFPTFGETTLGGSFTAATGSPSGYLVLRRAGASPTGIPADGTTYSVGNTLGDGTVVATGSGTTFSDTGLSPNTIYHYDIFSYNGSGAAINYRSVSPLEGSRTTLVVEPAAQPTALTFPTFTETTLGGSFTAATGSPAGYLVLRRAGASPTGVPADGTTYSIGNTLGDGTVVAVGAGTTFSDAGLSANTVYHYDVFSYNGSGAAINYRTVSPLENSRTTLATEPTAQPGGLNFSNPSTSSVEASFTAASGSPSGYLVLRKQGSFPTGTPNDGQAYSIGSSIGDGTVVHTSAATNFTDAGLVAGTVYHYAVFSFNGSGAATNYRIPGPATNSVITICSPPAAQPATSPGQTAFQANWNSVTGAASYRLDVSSDNFSNLLPGYADRNVTGLNELVTGLTPGITYQYRVRASNASGVSLNSATISQITVPATPVANAGSNIGTNDFKASWNAITGITGYELDVSANNFVSFIPGYSARPVSSSLTEETVFGLSPNTQYQYRVRSLNNAGASPNSNVIIVTTGAIGDPLSIGVITFNNIPSGQSSAGISVEVTGGTNPKTVQLFHRKITNTGAHAPISMANPSGNNTTFVGDLSVSAFDELGVEFFIRASDASANPALNSTTRYIYRSFTDQTSQAIPSIVRHGGTQKSYQIISIPFSLAKPGIADIFEPELGAYDKTKWRLVRFQNNKNTDYKAGINNIEQGKSYWFNSVSEVTIKTGAGTTPNHNQSASFTMPLAQGWNQVATPYPFAIDWDDVLTANGNPAVGNYKVFNSNQLSFDVTNSMKPFEGGFVFADNAVPSLSFPVTLKNTAGGRMKQDEEFTQDIDSETWLLPLKLVQDEVVNKLGGIGMHPQARPGKDRFDDVTVPRFVQYLESNFYHPEFFWPKFSRDVVPATEEYEWNLVVESNGSGPITLRWDAGSIANAQSALYLVDEEDARVLDMRVESSIAFSNTDRKELKLVYTHKGEYTPSRTRLGTPWPNPASREVNIPFTLAGSNKPYRVEVDVYDLKGVKVATLSMAQLQAGAHVSVWDTRDGGGSEMPNAIYIIKLNVNGRYLPEFSRVVVNRSR